MLNLHRDKKIVRREPGRDGKILIVTTGRMVMMRSIGYKRDLKKKKKSETEHSPHVKMHIHTFKCIFQVLLKVEHIHNPIRDR